MENSSQIRRVVIRDLEPIQDRSLVDFPDYVIKERRNSIRFETISFFFDIYFYATSSW